MKSYAEWCKHYDYDPEDTQSEKEYEWYIENHNTFSRLINSEPLPERHYWIKGEGDKGYWKPGGYGYTDDIEQAGIFAPLDLITLNLNGCTLYDVKQSASLRSR